VVAEHELPKGLLVPGRAPLDQAAFFGVAFR